jgi:hypothetical protein
MASGHASLTSGASVEIHLKRVLFPGPGQTKGDQVTIVVFQGGRTTGAMALRKSVHRRQTPLVGDQGIDQCFKAGLGRERGDFG